MIFVIIINVQPNVEAYCKGIGSNPSFTGTPKVKQIDLSRVQVSWTGLVARIDCADQFLVKYWPTSTPNQWKTSTNQQKTHTNHRKRTKISGSTSQPPDNTYFGIVRAYWWGYLGLLGLFGNILRKIVRRGTTPHSYPHRQTAIRAR